jgi:hypothetical protein
VNTAADLLLQQHCLACEDGQVDKRFDLERKKAVCGTAQISGELAGGVVV